jgi:hypothetical protein
VKLGPAKAVVESTGNLWLRIYEALESCGVEVKLANPFKTKAIASARWTYRGAMKYGADIFHAGEYDQEEQAEGIRRGIEFLQS